MSEYLFEVRADDIKAANRLLDIAVGEAGRSLGESWRTEDLDRAQATIKWTASMNEIVTQRLVAGRLNQLCTSMILCAGVREAGRSNRIASLEQQIAALEARLQVHGDTAD